MFAKSLHLVVKYFAIFICNSMLVRIVFFVDDLRYTDRKPIPPIVRNRRFYPKTMPLLLTSRSAHILVEH